MIPKNLKIILVLTLFLVGTASFAERGRRGGNLNFNIYGGFSATSHQVEGGVFDPISDSGLAYGAGVEYLIMNKFYVTLDMLYLTKSFKSRIPTITRYDVNYLEFPIRVKWAPTTNIAFSVGPFLPSFTLKATKTTQGEGNSVKANFANDFGVQFGVWLGFNAGTKLSVGLDFRYDLGFADIDKDLDPANTLRTRTAIFMANFSFNL